MRTEQFLNGYNDCRKALQSLLSKIEHLQSYNELKDIIELAEYPYYKEDGRDWDVLCQDCKNWELDTMDWEYFCKIAKFDKIQNNKCESRE